MKHNRLLKEKYKTFEGAHKRAAFERGVAPSEYRAGYQARVYAYRVVFHDEFYRVERFLAPTAPNAVLSAMETETSPLPDSVSAAWDAETDPAK